MLPLEDIEHSVQKISVSFFTVACELSTIISVCFAGFWGDSNIYQSMRGIKLGDYWWGEVEESIPGRNSTHEGPRVRTWWIYDVKAA